MSIKKTLTLLILSSGMLSAWAPLASAHVLQTDGSIGAVLHIDPEDDPIVAQPSTFFLEFKDKQGKFRLTDCQCTVTITEQGTEGTKQVFSQNLSETTFSYTFPERAIYSLKINGMPKQAGQFQSFNLVYDLRVDRTVSAAAVPVTPSPTTGLRAVFSQDHNLHILLFGVGFAIIGFLYLKDKYKAKRAKINK